MIFISSYSGVAIPAQPQETKDFTTASGENWLIGWQYRKRFTFAADGDVGEVAFPIDLTVEHGSGSDGSSIVYCSSHCQTDFDDIRFTDSDGSTKLDYWLQEYTVSDDATFWVEVSLPAAGTDYGYIYYGRGSVSTTSNGTATFDFFDDFNDASFDTDLWSEDWSSGTLTESGGVLHLLGTGGSEGVLSDTTYGFNHAVGMSVKLDEQNNNDVGWDERAGGGYDGNIEYATISHRSGSKVHRFQSDAGADTNARAEDLSSDYFPIEIQWDATRIQTYISGSSVDIESTYIPTDEMGPCIYTYGTNNDVWADWVYVRPWAGIVEPYPYGWQSEEEYEGVPPEWREVGTAILQFFLPVDPASLWALNNLYILLGAGLVIGCGVYLVKGGKNEASMNKLFYVIVAFMIGWALIIGGVMP